jgi:hypothetical protein
MRKPQPGDRYIDSFDDEGIFQIIRVVKDYDDGTYSADVIVIEGMGGGNIDGYFISEDDRFIGNFNKSNQFKNIYNILNSEE